MSSHVVRRCALLLVVLAMCFGAPAQADPVSPGTISGTVSTPDGKPFTTSTLVTLYSWFPAGDASYPTPQTSVILPPGSDGTFSFTAPGAGHYAVRARPLAGSSYLTTWYGSGESIATESGQDGVLFIDEQLTPLTDKNITLRAGVQISGTVTGSNGQPIADATVDVSRWNGAGAVEPIPGVAGAITDADGHYRTVVASGTAVSLSVSNRAGYRPWVLGGGTTTRTADNALVVAGPTTQDVTLIPDWSDVGSPKRVVRDETCLQHAISGTADLGGLRLDVSSKGMVLPADADEPADPLAVSSATPTLVPYWSDTARKVTWGVSGTTLCAVWRSAVDGTAYQALVTRDGYVTYNYGSIGHNLYTATPEAGWTEGAGADHEHRLFVNGADDGYADSDPHGLVRRSPGVRGRMHFWFTGFTDTRRGAVGIGQSPAVRPASPRAGDRLRLVPGTWVVPSGSARDLQLKVQWLRDGRALKGATGRSVRTARSAAGAVYTVRVTAYRSGRPPVTARATVTLR